MIVPSKQSSVFTQIPSHIRDKKPESLSMESKKLYLCLVFHDLKNVQPEEKLNKLPLVLNLPDFSLSLC
jgi:hypothetical protein